MEDSLKLMLIMALFFGAMYLYAIYPDIIAKKKDSEKASLKMKKIEKRRM